MSATLKEKLIRGIDAIPENWEFVSAYAAIDGLRRSLTTLDRLTAAAAKKGARAEARDLKRVHTAVGRALDHIAGSFEREHIQPKADRVSEIASNFRAAETAEGQARAVQS